METTTHDDHTRQPRLPGDTNGDGSVDVSDKMNLISYTLGEETDVFIPEVSDVNRDDQFDVTDAMGVIEIALEGETATTNE